MKLTPSQRRRVVRLTERTFAELLKLTDGDPGALALAVTRMAVIVARTERRFRRKGRR